MIVEAGEINLCRSLNDYYLVLITHLFEITYLCPLFLSQLI